MDFSGILTFLVYFLVTTGIYGLLTMGLNVQWGYAGLLNIGVAGFYAAGAYASVYLTHGVGFGGNTIGLGLPFPLALAGAMAVAALVALFLGGPSLSLDKGYLAITLLGFGELARLVAANEAWLTNGTMGFSGVYKPLGSIFRGLSYQLFFFLVVAMVVLVCYLVVHRAHRSPWGRALRAIREDEAAAMMQGKNAFRFKLEAFILGAALMGAAGSLYAHYVGFINPSSFTSEHTFLIWIMLIVGGSGNDLGALLGTLAIWGFYVGSNFLLDLVPAHLTARLGGIRIMVITALFIFMLIKRPDGLLREKKWVSAVFKE
ncbi:MAG: transporter permease [Deltaproteobacteria bacterium]|jgi:branched-chain amino acid transport system permease protein|nr:transporter permease [Deltaproteobacteria bacterium]